MPSDSRRDAATAATGAVGLASGGGMRHAAISRMKTKPKVHLLGVLRNGTKGQKKLFAAGSALGLLSTAPLGVGVTRLASDDVNKALKVTGVRAVGGEWGTHQPNQNDLDRALVLARRFRTSSGKRRTTSLSEVLSGSRGNLAKADDKRGFWREGLSGSADALKLKGQSATQKVPASVRATQLGVAAGAGLGGSMLTRALLPKAARPFIGPVAGGLAATASVPGTNKLVQRKHPEYKVTAYGVTRQKKAPKRPSTRANIVSSRQGPTRSQIVPSDDRFAKRDGDDPGLHDMRASMRAHEKRNGLPEGTWRTVGTRGGGTLYEYVPGKKPRRKRKIAKAESYLGSRTSYPAQRAAVTLAGHPPIIGPITSAAAAGKYAPPGQERKHALRQWGMGSGAGAVAGVGGAYGGAHLAERSDRALRVAQGTLNAKEKVESKARSAVGMAAKKPLNPASFRGRQLARAMASKPGRALLGSNPEKVGVRAVGAMAGFLGTKAVTSTIGGQAAISLNQRDQTKYNRAHGIHKAAPVTGTKGERHRLAERKRLNAALSYTSGGLGLGGLALMAGGKGRLATKTSILAGGVGGTNSLIGASVQRREAKQVDPVAKLLSPVKGYTKLQSAVLARGPKPGTPLTAPVTRVARARLGAGAALGRSAEKVLAKPTILVRPLEEMAKRDPARPPLKTSISEDDARKLVARHGLKGPLPKQLNREQRRAAYEARYVSAGGHKAEHWQHRAIVGDKVKTAGLAGATAAGVPWLGARTRAGRAVGRSLQHAVPALRRVSSHRLAHHAETAAGASAIAGGGGELYAAHARRKRSSYASAPAGVAASALRRMQDYDPETT